MNSLELLPSRLAIRSLDDEEIVLPMKEALEAIDALEKRGVRILGWEGWIRSEVGKVGHGGTPQGTLSLDGLNVDEAAQLCRKTIREEGERWLLHNPKSTDELYFCITSPA